MLRYSIVDYCTYEYRGVQFMIKMHTRVEHNAVRTSVGLKYRRVQEGAVQ